MCTGTYSSMASLADVTRVFVSLVAKRERLYSYQVRLKHAKRPRSLRDWISQLGRVVKSEQSEEWLRPLFAMRVNRESDRAHRGARYYSEPRVTIRYFLRSDVVLYR